MDVDAHSALDNCQSTESTAVPGKKLQPDQLLKQAERHHNELDRTAAPPPVHKAAKKHLKKLMELGYSSFEETGVEYYEPRH